MLGWVGPAGRAAGVCFQPDGRSLVPGFRPQATLRRNPHRRRRTGGSFPPMDRARDRPRFILCRREGESPVAERSVWGGLASVTARSSAAPERAPTGRWACARSRGEIPAAGSSGTPLRERQAPVCCPLQHPEPDTDIGEPHEKLAADAGRSVVVDHGCVPREALEPTTSSSTLVLV